MAPTEQEEIAKAELAEVEEFLGTSSEETETETEEKKEEKTEETAVEEQASEESEEVAAESAEEASEEAASEEQVVVEEAPKETEEEAVAEAPPEPPAEDMVVAALQDQLDAANKELLDRKIPEAKVETVETASVETAIATPGARDTIEYIKSDEEFTEFFTSSKRANEIFTQIHAASVQEAIQRIPLISSQVVTQQFALRAAVEDFYKANEDLVPHKKLMEPVSNAIMARKPEISLDDLFTESAEAVRKHLKIEKVAAPKPRASKKPAFAGSKSSRKVRSAPADDEDNQTLAEELGELMTR